MAKLFHNLGFSLDMLDKILLMVGILIEMINFDCYCLIILEIIAFINFSKTAFSQEF